MGGTSSRLLTPCLSSSSAVLPGDTAPGASPGMDGHSLGTWHLQKSAFLPVKDKHLTVSSEHLGEDSPVTF